MAPKYASAYYFRGSIYVKQGNDKQAMNDMNKAIELDPKMSEAYFIRGAAYYSLGNYQQVVEDLNKVINLKSGADKIKLGAHAILGNAYSKLGNIEQATSEWKIAAKLGDKGAQNLLRGKGIAW
jgi:tetratricopeptide (TPR) repeat protein